MFSVSNLETVLFSSPNFLYSVYLPQRILLNFSFCNFTGFLPFLRLLTSTTTTGKLNFTSFKAFSSQICQCKKLQTAFASVNLAYFLRYCIISCVIQLKAISIPSIFCLETRQKFLFSFQSGLRLSAKLESK